MLTDDPGSPHWRRLRIKTVAYPNPDSTHGAVPGAISQWASWASMGLLDHRQQIADLVATPPFQVPEEMSYLEAIVADGDTVRFLTERARGQEWLSILRKPASGPSMMTPQSGRQRYGSMALVTR